MSDEVSEGEGEDDYVFVWIVDVSRNWCIFRTLLISISHSPLPALTLRLSWYPPIPLSSLLLSRISASLWSKWSLILFLHLASLRRHLGCSVRSDWETRVERKKKRERDNRDCLTQEEETQKGRKEGGVMVDEVMRWLYDLLFPSHLMLLFPHFPPILWWEYESE